MSSFEISRRQVLSGTAAAIGAAVLTGAASSKAAPPAAASSEGLVVSTRYGLLKGVRDGSIRSFKGIPYAAPPVGTRRFLAPQPPVAWNGVRDASTLGHPSIQDNPDYPAWLDPRPESEDCLYLNVWTPSRPNSEPLPVMVWLHGGGYIFGSAGAPVYDGAKLAETAGVVVVSINHRLNAFGYAWFGDIVPELAAHATPGQQDIVRALLWVRDNIAALGGDPANVTLFGESGGGGKVNSILATPSAKSLFHKGIIQSGAQRSVSTREQGTEVASAFLAELGPGKFDLQRLQNVSVQDIKRAASAVIGSMGGLSFQPVVDGSFMPQQTWQNGAPSPATPLIIGTNSHEGLTYLPAQTEPESDEEMAKRFVGNYFAPPISTDEFYALLNEYRGVMGETSRLEILTAMLTDTFHWHSAVLQAEMQTTAGGPAYFYEFAWETPCFEGTWAPHGAELPFVFGNQTYATAWDGQDTDNLRAADDPAGDRFRLADEVMNAWGSFAHTGNPSTGALRWPSYDSTSRATMVFARGNSYLENDRNSARRNLISNVPTVVWW
ncbi:carboxylesterase family protein [Arthrobacter globiformis]|uniref:carboxylesterase/lipase family protein n=1 Tax=Arthrobacter globiformis TaxID=1665 RepID=UPI003979ED50